MQCEATAEKTGKQCRRDAMRTGAVCIMHAVPNADPRLPVADLRSFDKSGRRCGARTRKGTPCSKFAIPGGSVCPTHGGRSPDVRRKARERLLDLVHPAVAELSRIVQAPGTTDSDKLKAIQMILDRTGHHTRQTVEIEVKPWESLLSGIVVEDGELDEAPSPTVDPYALTAVPDREDEDLWREMEATTATWPPPAEPVKAPSPTVVPEHLR